jgi:hypothetical protein
MAAPWSDERGELASPLVRLPSAEMMQCPTPSSRQSAAIREKRRRPSLVQAPSANSGDRFSGLCNKQRAAAAGASQSPRKERQERAEAKSEPRFPKQQRKKTRVHPLEFKWLC